MTKRNYDRRTDGKKTTRKKQNINRQTDKKTIKTIKTQRHKDKRTKRQIDKDQKENMILRRQGSFALLRCFLICSNIDMYFLFEIQVNQIQPSGYSCRDSFPNLRRFYFSSMYYDDNCEDHEYNVYDQ